MASSYTYLWEVINSWGKGGYWMIYVLWYFRYSFSLLIPLVLFEKGKQQIRASWASFINLCTSCISRHFQWLHQHKYRISWLALLLDLPRLLLALNCLAFLVIFFWLLYVIALLLRSIRPLFPSPFSLSISFPFPAWEHLAMPCFYSFLLLHRVCHSSFKPFLNTSFSQTDIDVPLEKMKTALPLGKVDTAPKILVAPY